MNRTVIIQQCLNNIMTCLLLLNIIISIQEVISNTPTQRQWWVRPDITVDDRFITGDFSIVFEYFQINNHEQFYAYDCGPILLFT